MRRTVGATLIASGDIAMAAGVLSAEGFRRHEFINNDGPGMYLPASRSQGRSMHRWEQTLHRLQAAGFEAVRGMDELAAKNATLATARERRRNAGAKLFETTSPDDQGNSPRARKTRKVQVPVKKDERTVFEPELGTYDLIAINSSAGKDSQAMLDEMVHKASAAGVLDRLVVVYSDLGRVVAPGTDKLAEAQAAHYGVRFHRIAPQTNDLLVQIEFVQGSFPTSGQRYCTSDHKSTPVSKFFTMELKQAALGRPMRILNCLGFRREESANRNVELALSVESSTKNREVHRYLPVLEWSVDDVWARIDGSGVPYAESYDMGSERHSCTFCIFGSRIDLINGALADPELAARYVGIEERRGHTLQPGKSLRSITDLVGITDAEIAGAPAPELPDHLREQTENGHFPVYDRVDKAAQRAAKNAPSSGPHAYRTLGLELF